MLRVVKSVINSPLYKELKPYSPKSDITEKEKLLNIKKALKKSLHGILDSNVSDLGCLNVWAIRTHRDLHDIKNKLSEAKSCFEIVDHLLHFHGRANRLFTPVRADVAQFLVESLTALNSGVTKVFRNGDTFKGVFIGRRLYYGKYKSKSKDSKYVGYFKNGKAHGLGKIKDRKGNTYEGNWQKGRMHGTGIYKFHSPAAIYTGNFKNGLRHGDGKLEYTESRQKYVGGWSKGQHSGQGMKVYDDGSKYHGSFKKGKRHGLGTYTLAQGEREFVVLGVWKQGNLIHNST